MVVKNAGYFFFVVIADFNISELSLHTNGISVLAVNFPGLPKVYVKLWRCNIMFKNIYCQ